MSNPAKSSAGMRLRLLMSSALAGAAAMVHSQAYAQNIVPEVANAGGAVTQIVAGMMNDDVLNVDLVDSSRVIDYNSFNLGPANAVNFTTADSVTQFAVLNRVILANPSSILGAVNSQNNIAVWLVNPSGITFGSGATFSGGALALSTADISNTDFLDGNSSYNLAQGAVTGLTTDSQIVLASGSTIGAPNGFVAVAQDVQASGTISVGTGNVALIAAADTVLDFTPGGPLSVNVTAGTTIGTAQVRVGTGAAITAGSITLAGAAASAPMANLLNIDTGASLTATAVDGRVTIATATDSAGGVTIGGAAVAGAIDVAGALSATAAGGDIGITSNASAMTSGQLNAADTITIAAAQGLAVAGGVSVGGTYTARAAFVSMGDNVGGATVAQSAGGAIDITATVGSILGFSGLTLASNRDGVGAEALVLDAASGGVNFAAGSSVVGGVDGDRSSVGIRLGSATDSVTLDTVNGARLANADAAHNVGTALSSGPLNLGAVTLTQTLDATTTGSIGIGSVSITGAGQNLSLTANGVGSDIILAGAASASGMVALTAGDMISGTTVSGAQVAATAGGPITFATTTSTAGATSLAAGTSLVVDSVSAIGGGATLAGTLIDADSVTADGLVQATGGDVEVNSVVSNTGDVQIAASGNVTGRAGSGSRIALTAIGAGSDISVMATGTALLGALSAGQDLTVTAGAIDLSPAAVTTPGALSLTATASDIAVGSVTAGTSALVASTTGSATVAGTITAQNGSATVAAVNLASVAGATAGGTPGNILISGGSVALSGTQSAANNVVVNASGGTITGAADLMVISNSDQTGGGTTSIVSNNGAINLASGSTLVSLGGPALNSGVTLNSGTADLTFGNVTADSLTVGGAPANIASTGAILTSSSLSLTTAGSLSLDTAETIGVASQIMLSGGTTASANVLRAVAGVTVSADALTLGTVIASQGFIDLDADVGALSLVSGQAFTGATVTKTGATGVLTITSLQAGMPAGAASSDIDIDSSTDAALGNISANVGNVTIDAAGNVTGIGVGARANIAAANDLASATLTATDKSVTINTGGQALLGMIVAGRDVAVSAAAIDAANVTAASNLLALQANGGQLTLGTGTAGTTASLSKTGVTGDLRVTGSLIAGNEAGSNATVTLLSDSDIALPVYDSGTGNGVIRSLTGDVVVTAGGSVTDVAGSATPNDRGFGTISTTGALSITSSDDIRADTLRAGTDLTIDTAGSITDNGAGTTGTAVTGGGLFAQGAGRTVAVVAGGKAQLNTIAADSGVTITAPSIAIGTIAINSGATSLNEAPAMAADGANYYVGSLTSAGSLALTLAGTPDAVNATSADFTLAPGFGGADLSAGGAISVIAGGAAQIDEASSGTSTAITANAVSVIDAEAATSLALIATGGGLYLGTGAAGTGATLDHQSGAAIANNELRVVTGLTSGGPITITTATDARIASAIANGGGLAVRAAGAITGMAGATPAGPLDPARGRALLTTNGSGNDLLIDAGGIAQIGSAIATGSIALRAAEVYADGLTASEDVAVRSLGGAAIQSASAGDDIEVRAAGNVTLGAASASGLGPDVRRAELDGAILSFGAETLTRSNGLIDAIGNISLGTGAIAATLGVRSGGTVSASNLLAGEDIAISSGGDTVIGTAIASDDIEITSAGGIQFLTLARTAGLAPVNDDRRLDLNPVDPAFGAETRTGSDLALLATGAGGSIIVQRAEVAGDATLEAQGASGDVEVTDLLEAVGDATIVSARDARLGTVRSTTANINAAITGNLAGVIAPSAFGAGTGLRVASLIDRGTTLIDAATGDVRIGSVSNNGGNVTVASGGSTTGLAIADLAAGPGANLDAVLGNITANAGGRAAIGSASAAQLIAIGAGGISAGSAVAGTTLSLAAADALSLDSGSAAGVTLTTSGGAAGAIDLTDANSAQDKLSDAFGAAAITATAPTSSVTVTAGGGAQLGTVGATGSVTVDASAISAGTVNAGDALSLTARLGGLYLGSGTAGTTGTLTKLDNDANGLADVNRDELRVRTALTAGGATQIDSSTDARINAATGAAIMSTVTRDLTGIVPPGPAAIALGLRVASLSDGGATLIDAATGDVRIGTLTNSGGSVVVESGDVASATGGSVTGLAMADIGAGSGANLMATGGSIGVNAGGRVAIGTAVASGGGIDVTGAQISAQGATASGTLSLAAADALSLDSGSAAGVTLTTSGGAAGAIDLTDANSAQDKLSDAFGAAAISATAPTSSITVTAGGGAQLGTVGATGSVTVDASAISAGTVNAGDALSLTARLGGLYLGSGTAGTTAALSKLDNDANGLADVNRDELRVRTALTAGGATQIDSSTDARINSASGASITSTVTRDLTGLVPPGPSAIGQGIRIGSLTDTGTTGVFETAGDIRIGSLTSVDSDISLRAGGSVTGLSTLVDLPAGPGANLTATGTSISATAGNRAAIGTATAATSISVAAPQISVQNANAGTTLTLAAGDALSLDSGSANGANLSASGGIASAIALTSPNAIFDAAFGSANLSATGTGRSISVMAGQAAQLGAVSAGGSISVDAAAVSVDDADAATGSLDLLARSGGLYVDDGDAALDATLIKRGGTPGTANDEIRVTTAIRSGRDVGIDSSTDARIAIAAAARDLTANATSSLTGLVPPGPNGIATGIRVGALTDSGATAINAASGDIRIGSIANSGGDVGVSAGGSVTGLAAADMAAGPGAQLTATTGTISATAGQRVAIGSASAAGAITAAAAQISVQSANAGGALNLSGGGAVSLDSGVAAGATITTLSGAAQAIAQTDAGVGQDRLTDAFGTANIAATGSGRSATVTAGQGAQLGTVGANGVATVTAAAISAATVNAGGALILSAGQGALYLGSGSAGGTATVSKADADGDGLIASQAGRDELRIRTALTATGNISITSATDNRLAGGVFGSGVSSTTGSVAISSVAATTGLLGAGTGASDPAYARGDVAASAAGQDVNVTSGGLTQLGTVTAGRNATIVAGDASRNGAIDVATVSATSGALSLGARASGPITGTVADGDVIIGTGSAGTTATLINRDRGGTAGDIVVSSGLAAGGNIAITSAANARLAGDDAARGITSTNGSIMIDTLQSVTGISSVAGFGRANLVAAGAGQDVTVLARGLVQGGTLNAGRNISVTAGSEALGNGAIDITSATASAGSLLLSTRATGAGSGNITLGTGSAGTTATLATTDRGGITGNVAINTSLTAAGLVTIDAADQAAVNALTSTDGNVLIRSNQIAVNGIVRSAAATGEVRLINRIDTGTTQVNDTVLGAGGTEANQFVLSDAEIDRLQASRVVIQTLQTATQTQNVAIDAISIAPATGTALLDILADRNATISINGAISAQDSPAIAPETATRTLRIGGADIADPSVMGTNLANRIIATTTATAGGRIDLPALNVELRANRIVVGLPSLRDAVIGLTPEQVADDFIANANSLLFDARGNYAPGAPAILTANSLTVRYRDFALFQNTGSRGAFTGAVLGPLSQSTIAPVRLRLISNGAFPASNAFALFGVINGFVESSTALLPPAVVSFSDLNGSGIRINQSSSRLNGCVLGAPDLGCLTTTNPAPQLQLFDESQILLLSSTLDAPVDFDPLIGANNESLFVDFGGFQVPTEDDECTPSEGVDCPAPEGSE